MKAIMLCFEAVLGIKDNFHKNELIGVGLEKEKLSAFANILGCKVATFPVSYFGLPLCVGQASKSPGNPVVDRVEQRLAVWTLES